MCLSIYVNKKHIFYHRQIFLIFTDTVSTSKMLLFQHGNIAKASVKTRLIYIKIVFLIHTHRHTGTQTHTHIYMKLWNKKQN